jgi:hypothetical protein
MRPRASSWCRIGILTRKYFAKYQPCGGHPRSTFFRVASVGANGAVHVLAGCGLTGSHQRPQHEVELRPGLPLSSHSPPQEGCEETGGVEGRLSPRHSILGGPDMVRELPVSSSPRSPSPPLPRRSRGRPHDGGTPSISGTTISSRLEDLRGSWGVDAVSDRSFRLIAAGWVQSSEDRYERAWQSFKSFLRASSVPLHQATLRTVTDYLTTLRRGYVVEHHSHPQIHDFYDDGAS